MFYFFTKDQTSGNILNTISNFISIDDSKKMADTCRLFRKTILETSLPLLLKNYQNFTEHSTKRVIGYAIVCGPHLQKLDLTNRFKKIEIRTLNELGKRCYNLKELIINPYTVMRLDNDISENLFYKCEKQFDGHHQIEHLLHSNSHDEYHLCHVTELLQQSLPYLEIVTLQDARFPSYIERPGFLPTEKIKQINTLFFDQFIENGKSTFSKKEIHLKQKYNFMNIAKQEPGIVNCLTICEEYSLDTPEDLSSILESKKFSKISYLDFSLDSHSMLEKETIFKQFIGALSFSDQKITHLSLRCQGFNGEKLAKVFGSSLFYKLKSIELTHLEKANNRLIDSLQHSFSNLTSLKISGFKYIVDTCEKLVKCPSILSKLERLHFIILNDEEEQEYPPFEIPTKKDQESKQELKQSKFLRFNSSPEIKSRERTISNPKVVKFNKIVTANSKIIQAVKSLSKDRPTLQLCLMHESETTPLYAGNFDDNRNN